MKVWYYPYYLILFLFCFYLHMQTYQQEGYKERDRDIYLVSIFLASKLSRKKKIISITFHFIFNLFLSWVAGIPAHVMNSNINRTSY